MPVEGSPPSFGDGGGAFVDRSICIGTGYDLFDGRDLVAVGLNWGRAPKSSGAPGPRDQYTAELFYRYQPFSNLQLTPGIQLIANPANDRSQDLLAVFAFRARATF